MKNRNEKLSLALKDLKLDALFITKYVNQRYLEGFTGHDCFLLASAAGNFLIADSRYTEMAERECAAAKIVPHRAPHPPLEEVAARLAREAGFKRIGFEAAHMTYSQYESISKALSAGGVSMTSTTGAVEKIRAIKEPEESRMTEKACGVADRALEELLKILKPGVSELDVRTELDYLLKRGGAEDVAFETMALFGSRASQPHANSSRDVILSQGDFILIDYGATVNGYKSDTTRTFVCGRADPEQKRAYDTVRYAQAESLALVKPGANGRDVNDRAIGILKGAGFPPFEYGIGHGVGLEIHEEPFMRQKTDITLEPGMILTVEPGIYIPSWGGIRIEDTVLVTEDGHKVLTNFTKELIEL
ncbi:MAG: Xaa-Pro peptidase family protein [Synergistaceae bacterium]|jgi:Xaa-Pro aminopeptidase|nr:Xaa-Pro peptidase family protein [Synergistaceae bacterium]